MFYNFAPVFFFLLAFWCELYRLIFRFISSLATKGERDFKNALKSALVFALLQNTNR